MVEDKVKMAGEAPEDIATAQRDIAEAFEAVRAAHSSALEGWSGRAADAARAKFAEFYAEAEEYKKAMRRLAARSGRGR